MGSEALDLRVYRKGTLITELRAAGDPDDVDSMRRLLAEAIARDGWDGSRIDEFEMQIRYAGDRRLVTTFVASANS